MKYGIFSKEKNLPMGRLCTNLNAMHAVCGERSIATEHLTNLLLRFSMKNIEMKSFFNSRWRLRVLLAFGILVPIEPVRSHTATVDEHDATSSPPLPKEVPTNAVVLRGTEKTLGCASDYPFRWYKYRLDNPFEDDVIWMGLTMASRVNASHIRVYKTPDRWPYDRLDLRIIDVQSSDAGTYKCMLHGSSLCAELIVLDSEPRCVINSTDETDYERVALECDVSTSHNGEPEMQCANDRGNASLATCSKRSDGAVKCVLTVPAASRFYYSCEIKIKSKPARSYKYCIQATNDPEYRYAWKTKDAPSVPCRAAGEWGFEPSKKSAIACLSLFVVSLLGNVLAITRILFKNKMKRPIGSLAESQSTPPPRYESAMLEAPTYCSVGYRTSREIPEYHSLARTPPTSTIGPPAAEL